MISWWTNGAVPQVIASRSSRNGSSSGLARARLGTPGRCASRAITMAVDERDDLEAGLAESTGCGAGS